MEGGPTGTGALGLVGLARIGDCRRKAPFVSPGYMRCLGGARVMRDIAGRWAKFVKKVSKICLSDSIEFDLPEALQFAQVQSEAEA